MSPYHGHRIYRAVHGEALAATVKRLRLQRAATELAASDRSISSIARRCGYPNLQSFNRIFKAASVPSFCTRGLMPTCASPIAGFMASGCASRAGMCAMPRSWRFTSTIPGNFRQLNS